ncbi:hypothetical protein SAY86_028021 [Trapa natans]|uniref:Uncharacterized protein n=1 Tax=Trapa natans TaxID=22666 RepID=A0AAN7RBU1_TRANT|nr:hypothetical protein SAY86_028021 [Trapa natans]
MALETWLLKKLIWSALSNRQEPTTTVKRRRFMNRNSKNNTALGILSFETAGHMSKLLYLWRSLSEKSLILHYDSILSLDGVRKIVSTDESFLLGLLCAELVESLRAAAAAAAHLGLRCVDPNLSEFGEVLVEFANTGRDPNGWAMGLKEMESMAKKADRYVKATASLQRAIHEVAALEGSLKKTLQITAGSSYQSSMALDLRQKIFCKREEVKSLQKRSLWGHSCDSATLMLVRLAFTVLARIKLVFCLREDYTNPISWSLPASAAILPGRKMNKAEEGGGVKANGFFESNSKALRPPATTLGDAALAHHYAGLIIVIEKMIQSPQLIGLDAREDLYSMLPESIRSALRSRLRGVRMWVVEAGLAAEWDDAIWRILGWLSPLAHNTIKWQSERNFDPQSCSSQQQKMAKNSSISSSSNGNNSVFLLQTLYFASKDKAEAAISELLVGLNYIWRFEKEMTTKALYECKLTAPLEQLGA